MQDWSLERWSGAGDVNTGVVAYRCESLVYVTLETNRESEKRPVSSPGNSNIYKSYGKKNGVYKEDKEENGRGDNSYPLKNVA